jgi:starch synthase
MTAKSVKRPRSSTPLPENAVRKPGPPRRPSPSSAKSSVGAVPPGGPVSPPPPTVPAVRALRIVMVASEAQPFSKTGGLADVASSLTRALGRLGHDVTLITPRYRGVEGGIPREPVRALVADHWFDAELLEVPLGPGARALLVDCPPLFDRAGIYTEHNVDYADNAVRFAFLSVAALEWAAAQPQAPSILHAHDWQAGLLPVYARRLAPEASGGDRPLLLAQTPSVFTIHNLAYQGIFAKSWVPRLGLPWGDFTVAGFEFWDHLSFLKAGVMFADALTTVSPTYAEEIQRPEDGYGFDGVMRSRADALVGILNGIDHEEWNPAHDRFLPLPFDAEAIAGKHQAKRALLESFALPTDDETMARPIVGMVSRMVEQKGLDLIAALGERLADLDATFTVVGTGEPRYQEMWRQLAAAHPRRIAAYIGFDERRAHLVEGGADIFLMPSRFEPCGLNQMYSMRYGTVPVVRAVGGLVDTVRPYNPKNGQGTGFLFSDYAPGALLEALVRALDTFRQPKAWRRLQINGMKRDFSWDRSAAEYVKVYKRVIAARRNRA